MTDPWKPISCCPSGRWVEVAGDSGYMNCANWFMAIAKHDPNYRPLSPWIDVTGTCLEDHGWRPVLWRELELPTGRPGDYK